MKKFFTAVSVFSLLCSSVVFAQNTAEFSDYDREYYILMLNENVKMDYLDANPKNVIVQDLRPDDNVKNLWLWDETYVAGAATGADYYGEFDGYLSLNLTGVTDWSGGGLAVSKDNEYYVDYTGLTGDHVLHMALKSSSNISHLFILGLGGNLSGSACVGASSFVDQSVTYQPVRDFAKDNQWHLVEIPLSEFSRFSSPEPFNDGNYFSFLSGDNPGANIAMDAIFIYGDVNSSSIGEAVANSRLDAIVTNNVVTFVGTNGNAVELYNVQGILVKTLSEPIIGVDELASGLYIAKSGSATAKFIIK